MESFLSDLKSFSFSTGSVPLPEQQKLIQLIDHLSSNENWELCATFILSETQKCSTSQQISELENSASFFVCCRSIETFIKSGAASRQISSVEVEKMSTFLIKWLKMHISLLPEIKRSLILKRKIAQILCLSIVRYYPEHWSSFFDDILNLFAEVNVQQLTKPLTKSNPIMASLFQSYLELLRELDAFILNREVQITPEEVSRANSIKDSMRSSCLPSLIQIMAQVLKSLDVEDSNDRELVCHCLQVLGLYTSWIDINLIVNDQLFPILRNLVQFPIPDVLCSLCIFLKCLVSKGMSAFPDKLSLILGIWSELIQPMMLIPNVAKLTDFPPDSGLDDQGNEDPDEVVTFLQEFSILFGSIGYNLTEIYRAVVSSNTCESSNSVDTSIFSQSRKIDSQTLNSALELSLEKLEISFNLSVSLLAYPDSDVNQGVLLFIGDYLGLFKKATESVQPTPVKGQKVLPSNVNGRCATESGKILLELNSERRSNLGRLLRVLVDRMKYPVDADTEEFDNFDEDRQEYLSIVRSIARIDGVLVLDTVQNLLQTNLLQLQSSSDKQKMNNNFARLETGLYLFFSVGEFLKAPRNDHFAKLFAYSGQMTAIMKSICSSQLASIAYYPIQLNFFEIIGRYDKFFNTHSEMLFNVSAKFLDECGLRNPLVKVRSRCAYLFSRLVKSHKNTLAPHAEEILRQLESLLPIASDPCLPASNNNNVNGPSKSISSTVNQPLFSITEQSFLYESAAHLILAARSTRASVAEIDNQASQLFAMLLRPILLQFPDLVRLLANEKDPTLAESRGGIIKQAADLITRTTRVMSSQSPPDPCFIPILMDILDVMVCSLAYLPSSIGSPGRSAACAGIRAYLHRLIGSIGPDCQFPYQPSKAAANGVTNTSDWLLMAITNATPQLIDFRDTQAVADPDVRWRELRDHMPLLSQMASRYKESSLPFLTTCLPPLVVATLNALAEQLHESQLIAMEERKCLRRSFLQLLHSIGQVLPRGVLVALGSDAADLLVSILALIGACLEVDDPVGMKYGFAFFTGIVAVYGEEESFYENFILSSLLPLCFLSPARPEFRIGDPQFVLTLNESVHCIYTINTCRGQHFQDFLQRTFLPQQNLAPNYIDSYLNSLRSNNLSEFQMFAKVFYSSFR